MDFRLSDEQLQIQTMVREFAQSEILPHVMSPRPPRFGRDTPTSPAMTG